jgi:hypothetical protein
MALTSLRVRPGGDADPRAVERFAPAVRAVLAALRSAGVADSLAAKSCCSLTSLLMCMSPLFTQQLCDGGVVRAVLAALGAHGASAAVQGQGVTVLARSLRAQPHTCADAARNGVQAAVFAAMCRHAPKSVELLRACCNALVLLPRAGASHAAQLGGVEPLCAALKAQHGRYEPDACRALCRMLQAWCEPASERDKDTPQEENRRRALAAGAAKSLVGVLNALRGDAAAQQAAAGALADLTLGASGETLAACSSADVIEAAVATMAALRGDAVVEQHCAHVLANVCVSAPMRLRAAQAGALPLLVRALRDRPPQEHPQRTQSCLGAIGNVCSGNDDTKRAAAAAGAVEAVVAALQACGSDATATRAACVPLLNLTKALPAHQRRAVAAGALPPLVAALRAHAAGDASLGATIAMALANTVGFLEAHQRAAASAGAIPALLAAMRAQPAHAALQEMCAVALGGACVDVAAHKAAACGAGALPLLVAALRAHPAAPSLQRNAAVALGNLVAGERSLVAQAGVAGVAEAVVAALQHIGASSADNAENALFALGHVIGVPANAARAVAAGAFAAIVAAQRAAATAPAVAQSAWDVAGLLVGMSSAAEAAAAAADAGLLPALVACLGTHLADVRRHADVHRAGAMLLSLLCERGGVAVATAAVRAGALTLWGGARALPEAEALRAASLRALLAAAHAHDGAPCGDAGCVRCAELRAQGTLCGLPGCGAKARAGDDAKKLQRCAACRAFAYCGAAHQRDDWGRHKAECAVLKRQLAATAGGPSAA